MTKYYAESEKSDKGWRFDAKNDVFAVCLASLLMESIDATDTLLVVYKEDDTGENMTIIYESMKEGEKK